MIKELLIKVARGISLHTPTKLLNAQCFGKYVGGIAVISSLGFSAVRSICK
jgi:hypothetical protein